MASINVWNYLPNTALKEIYAVHHPRIKNECLPHRLCQLPCRVYFLDEFTFHLDNGDLYGPNLLQRNYVDVFISGKMRRLLDPSKFVDVSFAGPVTFFSTYVAFPPPYDVLLDLLLRCETKCATYLMLQPHEAFVEMWQPLKEDMISRNEAERNRLNEMFNNPAYD